MRRNNIQAVVTFLEHNLSEQSANLTNTFLQYLMIKINVKYNLKNIQGRCNQEKNSTCIKRFFVFLNFSHFSL